MKNIIVAILYVVLFHLSAKLVFAVLGGFEMVKGLLGIDWMALLYSIIICFVAALVLISGLLIVDKNQSMKSIISISLIAILVLNIYQFFQAPNWFINTLSANFSHTLATNLVFGFVLIIANWSSQKASNALKQ